MEKISSSRTVRKMAPTTMYREQPLAMAADVASARPCTCVRDSASSHLGKGMDATSCAALSLLLHDFANRFELTRNKAARANVPEQAMSVANNSLLDCFARSHLSCEENADTASVLLLPPICPVMAMNCVCKMREVAKEPLLPDAPVVAAPLEEIEGTTAVATELTATEDAAIAVVVVMTVVTVEAALARVSLAFLGAGGGAIGGGVVVGGGGVVVGGGGVVVGAK
eukprot:754456-Hanusia_phi.AAC.1